MVSLVAGDPGNTRHGGHGNYPKCSKPCAGVEFPPIFETIAATPMRHRPKPRLFWTGWSPSRPWCQPCGSWKWQCAGHGRKAWSYYPGRFRPFHAPHGGSGSSGGFRNGFPGFQPPQAALQNAFPDHLRFRLPGSGPTARAAIGNPEPIPARGGGCGGGEPGISGMMNLRLGSGLFARTFFPQGFKPKPTRLQAGGPQPTQSPGPRGYTAGWWRWLAG